MSNPLAPRFSEGGIIPKPDPPKPHAPATFARETFQAFGRASSREALMDAMRAQAAEYFGCRVELRDASVQLGPAASPRGSASAPAQARYQGTSRWVARP